MFACFDWRILQDDEEVPVARFSFNLGVEDVEMLTGEEQDHYGVYLVMKLILILNSFF